MGGFDWHTGKEREHNSLIIHRDGLSLALECLFYTGSELNVTVAVRIVEVLQQSFSKGSIDISVHLSFLVTLLLGRISSQSKRYMLASDFSTFSSSYYVAIAVPPVKRW